jgi:inosine/xanthosine triphosphatase
MEPMKTVIVASHNPVKVQAAREGFARMFPAEEFTFQTLTTPSGVSDQPFSSQETLRGAYNRASRARELAPQADYWIGIEGGVEESPDGIALTGAAGAEPADNTAPASIAHPTLAAFAWVVVLSGTRLGKGRTGMLFLPPRVAELVHQGKELGEADDIVFGRTNSKQENGAVGLLTGNVIDRAAFYEQAVILALIPFRNPDLYEA